MDIVIQNITKSYGVQKAVDNISFKVNTGEIVGFLGPNGAGKTTTMKIITSYLSPDEGDVFIGGRSVRDNPVETKKYIGYLPENNPLYYDMPVIDYLEFCARIQGIEKSRVEARVAEMIRITGLNREKHKKIGELSKGYRQRVGLAQAMIHDPQILILDEPTSGLDPNQIAEIRKLIRELGREKTVILSTHILPEVEATCDRIFIINKGKLVADGTPDTLRKKAQGADILRVKIEDGNPDTIFKALKTLDSVTMVEFADRQFNRFNVHCKSEQVRREIFTLCVKNNWVLTELTPFETKLEDIFRELTMN
ncbi:MAG TPA: ATP-binding cassette domain-containing protein [Bacteroidales bacterium]|nr:ATP-binding cassette domain-containing protein [Bacteroidales bacterium]HOK74771.1 ATP-binding cassette domain-containing protein [Bacteroidales bacterium]HOM41629.1 ATP-binding cassette domain-containing protein [Bacteroidales bacterium]HPP93280.1 ATP-binding cassette domain-containing protein [Bacteroidales bacterium]HRT48560.1 ATP-binding cassette domain-containing protein [Bacteroidales bacterium]